MDYLDPAVVDGVVPVSGPTGTDGKNGVGNCGPGVPGTDISAEVINPAYFEIINAIKSAGIEPDGDDYTQLAQAMASIATAALPAGFITLYRVNGAIPAGWALCDGDNGTPDLRDRFVIGAGLNYGSGQTGGTLAPQLSGPAGSHTHQVSGATAQTAITEAQMPSHSHTVSVDPHTHEYGDRSGSTATRGADNDTDFQTPSSEVTNNETTAEANVGVSVADTGGGEGHDHAFTITSQSSGSHQHSIATPIPPYFGLRYIMKL